jgi:uncharacterized membrane protein
MDFIYFVGRFHVLALHLPIGIIYAVVLLEFLARKPRFAGLAAAANYLWAAAAVTAVITVAMGLMHASEGGFTGESLERHRMYGIAIAVASIALWIFRVKNLDTYRTLQPVTGIIMVVLVAMTGHYGGNMTHGSTYLVEYAPAPLKRLAGMEVREKASSAADADVFADVVHPMLELRCGSCHGEDTRKGKLSFATYELLMEGGEMFPAVVPKDLMQSELYARVMLPPTSDDYMPKEGKTPLTADQIAIIKWWIEAGAPGTGAVGTLNPPAEVTALISKELGIQ